MSALAAASSVLQIVDFAGRLILKSNEYRTSIDGVLTEHREHAAASQRLRDLADELARRPIRTGPSASSAQIALKEVTKECTITAQEFIMALDDLKTSECSQVWATFRSGFQNNLVKGKDPLHVETIIFVARASAHPSCCHSKVCPAFAVETLINKGC